MNFKEPRLKEIHSRIHYNQTVNSQWEKEYLENIKKQITTNKINS